MKDRIKRNRKPTKTRYLQETENGDLARASDYRFLASVGLLISWYFQSSSRGLEERSGFRISEVPATGKLTVNGDNQADLSNEDKSKKIFGKGIEGMKIRDCLKALRSEEDIDTVERLIGFRLLALVGLTIHRYFTLSLKIEEEKSGYHIPEVK